MWSDALTTVIYFLCEINDGLLHSVTAQSETLKLDDSDMVSLMPASGGVQMASNECWMWLDMTELETKDAMQANSWCKFQCEKIIKYTTTYNMKFVF